MLKCLPVFFLLSEVIYSQSDLPAHLVSDESERAGRQGSINFHSPENIKRFADYLFCEGDYLRAVEEYESIQDIMRNDTINFKIMLAYSEIGLYQLSSLNYNISPGSLLEEDGGKLFLKNRFLETPYSFFQISELGTYPFPNDSANLNYFNQLTSISYLFSSVDGITKDEIINPFEKIEKEIVSSFYEWKADPPYKSPALAGALSAVIPGSGKMYMGEWGDGITALLATGLLAFLAYDNFRADHTTRAWIFTGLGAFFYAGNIYGSVAAAQIFNARIDFEFNDGLKLFLEKKNYFLPEYEFCK
jgi:TM2 domain-containing membrane protein YozV